MVIVKEEHDWFAFFVSFESLDAHVGETLGVEPSPRGSLRSARLSPGRRRTLSLLFYLIAGQMGRGHRYHFIKRC